MRLYEEGLIVRRWFVKTMNTPDNVCVYACDEYGNYLTSILVIQDEGIHFNSTFSYDMKDAGFDVSDFCDGNVIRVFN